MLLFVSKIISNVTHNFTLVYRILAGSGSEYDSIDKCYPENRVAACGAKFTTEASCEDPFRLIYQNNCTYGVLKRGGYAYSEQIEQCVPINPIDSNTSKCLENIFNCCDYRQVNYIAIVAVCAPIAGIFSFLLTYCIVRDIKEFQKMRLSKTDEAKILAQVPNEKIIASLRS